MTFKIFIHCLIEANYTEKKWRGIDIKPGQFVSSISKLAVQNGMTIKQVRTALKHLEKSGEVARSGYAKYSVFTVSNWDQYQPRGKQEAGERASKGQTEGKQRASKGQQHNKYNKDNKENKDNNSLLRETLSHFDQAWELYPKKRGKAEVTEEQKAALESIPIDELIRAVNRYKDEMKDRDERFIMNGSRFFGSAYVDYLDDNYQAPKEKPKEGENKFHNFEQRQYDYDELEKRLLGKLRK